MIELGKIEEKPIGDVFKDKQEFSKYLSDNLDILSRKIGIDLSEIEGETEVPVGRYRCDITGGIVAVENQLGASDHDHLGKLLVYFSNQEVKIGVWICGKANPEHVKAVQWLNERSEEEESFYLLEVKIITIGDSKPAIDFDLKAGPEYKEIGRERRKFTGRESKWVPILREIGERFLELRPGVRLGRPASNHLKIPSDYRDIHYEWLIFGGDIKELDVALHFERKDEDNRKLVEELSTHKEELEKILGEKVHFGSWSYDRDTKWAKISVRRKFGTEMDDKTKKWASETMLKMYESLTPKLEKS